MGPSTVPHIQESDALVTCKLIFRITVSLFQYTHYEMKCLPGFLFFVINLTFVKNQSRDDTGICYILH